MSISLTEVACAAFIIRLIQLIKYQLGISSWMGTQEDGKLEDWNFGISVLKTKDMILSTVTPADLGTRWLTLVIGLEFRTNLGL